MFTPEKTLWPWIILRGHYKHCRRSLTGMIMTVCWREKDASLVDCYYNDKLWRPHATMEQAKITADKKLLAGGYYLINENEVERYQKIMLLM